MDDDKIANTAAALDIAFHVLLKHVRDQLPGLAMLVQEELERAAKDRTPELAGVTQILARYAAQLARRH